MKTKFLWSSEADSFRVDMQSAMQTKELIARKMWYGLFHIFQQSLKPRTFVLKNHDNPYDSMLCDLYILENFIERSQKTNYDKENKIWWECDDRYTEFLDFKPTDEEFYVEITYHPKGQWFEMSMK